MKIVHLLAPAAAGGLERVVHALSIGQQRRGHEVIVVPVVDQWSTDHPFAVPLLRAGIPVHAITVAGRAYLRQRRLLAELLTQLHPDVVHSHGSYTDVLDRAVVARLGIPSISTAHGMTGGDLKNRFYEYLDRRSWCRFDAVAAVSRPLADELRRFGVSEDRLHVVPNAWSPVSAALDRDAARRELCLPTEGFVAGWVGRMSREKGVDVFVDALTRLVDVPVHACLVGDGPERAAQQARAEQLGLSGRVRWTGLVQEAGRVFRAFDALVLSSRTEGVPMVLLEAMALGIPVASTAVGGIPDVVTRDDALLVAPEDPGALAAAIRSILEAPGAAERRVESAARRIQENFSEEAWLSKYDDVYRAALARRANGRQ